MMKEKRTGIKNVLYVLLPIIGGIICILAMYSRNNQAMFPVTLPIELEGHFCYDGENWYSLDEYEMTAENPKVVIRGKINQEIEDKWRLYFLRDHIGVSVYKNGELIYMDAQTEMGQYGIGLMDSMCGRSWDCCLVPDLSPEDVIEIHCVNYHKFGNEKAYSYLVDSLTITADTDMVISNELKKNKRLPEVISSVLIIIAIMILGAAVFARILRQNLSFRLFLGGLIILFVGGFIFFDTVCIMELDNLIALNTYGQSLCLMCYAYFLRVLIGKNMQGRIEKISYAAILAELILDVGIMVLVISGRVLIYDTYFVWCIVQGVLCIAFMVMMIFQMRKKECSNRGFFVAVFVLQIALMLDILGAFKTVYSSGTCTKVCFLFVVVISLLYILKRIILDYSAAARAKELEEKLTQKRIALAVSQIRTHFIFNVLTVISSFCKSDAKKADEALVCFSRYLRRNISILEKDELVFFSKELEHLEDYISLEQMRFGDAILFRKDISVTDFKVPPLVVQPIVENAIKHGFIEKAKSGIVSLTTKKDEEYIYIIVDDNGSGFDVQKDLEEESIGIKNVRFRLETMVHGSLDIESEREKGTKVTIKIPV